MIGVCSRRPIRDFDKLARSRDLHAGIILLEDGGLPRAEQLRVIRLALAELASSSDMVNCVMRVAADETVTFEQAP